MAARTTGRFAGSLRNVNGCSMPGGRWNMSLAMRLTTSFMADDGFAPGWKNTLITLAPGRVRDSVCSKRPASVNTRSTRDVTDFSISPVGSPG